MAFFIRRLLSKIWPFGSKLTLERQDGSNKVRFIGGTRIKVTDESWRPVKEKYLRMKVEDKRMEYYVKDFLDLGRIRMWPQYHDVQKLTKTALPKKYPVKFTINQRVSVGKASLIALELDAIVNSTTQSMDGSGGELDKLVHLAAGKELKLECMSMNGCDIGEAKLTGGYRLPAKYVIHTVGSSTGSEAQLNAAYKSILNVMMYQRIRTIGIPCISTQSSKFPPELAAHVALNNVRKFMEHNFHSAERICFAIHRDEDLEIYNDLMQVYFPLKN